MIMKKSTFSEKDSLELISQMLKQTKKNLEVGSGNIFLYYGYSAFFISLIVFVLVYFTAKRDGKNLHEKTPSDGLIVPCTGGEREKRQIKLSRFQRNPGDSLSIIHIDQGVAVYYDQKKATTGGMQNGKREHHAFEH